MQNYVKTLEYRIKCLKEMALSLRVIRELHQVLLKGVRGEYAIPGEFVRLKTGLVHQVAL